MDFFAHHLFTSVEGPKISVLNFEKTVLCPEMQAMMLLNTFKILQLLPNESQSQQMRDFDCFALTNLKPR